MKRALLIILSFLLITSGLVLLLQGFSRLYLAEPIYRILLLGRVLIAAIPQPILWGSLILIASLFGMRILFTGRTSIENDDRRGKQEQGRVHELMYWIQQSEQGQFFRWQIAHHLSNLALEALAYRQRTSEESVKRQVREGKIHAPETVRAYFHAGLSRVYSHPRGILNRILLFRDPQTTNAALDLDPQRAIEFIEHQLETPYDDEAI